MRRTPVIFSDWHLLLNVRYLSKKAQVKVPDLSCLALINLPHLCYAKEHSQSFGSLHRQFDVEPDVTAIPVGRFLLGPCLAFNVRAARSSQILIFLVIVRICL
uniref:Uncharacterized protein n=1 Tax=Schistocephalus solidus TaxID=70667 RepID=A0A0V0J8B6_SCHSO